MATPHVVGAAALVLQANPSYTPHQVASSLTTDATPDEVADPGLGTPNLLLYTGT
jgi:subtilisin family serine protease